MPHVVGAGPVAVHAADSERRAIAKYATPDQPLLFQRRGTDQWERVAANDARLASTDTLLALPGFHPEIDLDTGVHLQLWGNAREILPLPLSETRLTLYVPPQGIDADLTLQAGRLFLSTPKAKRPTIVRLRFRDEVWDVTLATPDSVVGVDLIGAPASGRLFNRELAESPRFVVYLGVLQGKASVRNGFQQSGDLLADAKWKWDSKGGRPGPAPKRTRTTRALPTAGPSWCPPRPRARTWRPPSVKWHAGSPAMAARWTSISTQPGKTPPKPPDAVLSPLDARRY